MPRIRGVVGISPIPGSQNTFPNIRVPTLILGGQGDPYGASFQAQYSSLAASIPKMLAEFRSSSQFESMHAVGLVPLGTHTTDPVVARYVLSFLKLYLAEDARYEQFLVTDSNLNRFARVP